MKRGFPCFNSFCLLLLLQNDMVYRTVYPPKHKETRCFGRFLWELEFASPRGELTYHGKGPFIEEPAYSYGFYMGKDSSVHEASIILRSVPANPTNLCHYVRMFIIEEASGKKKLFYKGTMTQQPGGYLDDELPTYCRGTIKAGQVLTGLLDTSNEIAVNGWIMSIYLSIVIAPIANRAWKLTFPSITMSYFKDDVNDFLTKWWEMGGVE